jgi:hypothetical protein
MTRALRIAALMQVLGWWQLITWFTDETRKPKSLVIGLIFFIVAAPFVWIDKKYKRRY